MTGLVLLFFLALGVLVGLVHFSALAGQARRLVGRAAAGGGSIPTPARMVLTVLGLTAAAVHSGPALLAATAGLLAARQLVLRRVGEGT